MCVKQVNPTQREGFCAKEWYPVDGEQVMFTV